MTVPDSIEISYQEIRNNRGEIIIRPLLNVSLAREGYRTQTTALLDTGADINILPYSIGFALGGDLDNQRLGITVSGNLSQYETRGLLADVFIDGLQPQKLAFAWIKTDDVPRIFGQVNFFLAFDVCFYRKQSKIVIQPSD